jgi:hypothetical protein
VSKLAKPSLPFIKVYMTRMTSSSLWEERLCVRVMFLWMLGVADEDGVVLLHTPTNLARLANMSLDDANHAIARLEAPDPLSRTKDEEGRRILRLAEGGWTVVNARAYREMQTPKQAYNALRQAKLRSQKAGKKRKGKAVKLTAEQREKQRFDEACGNVAPVSVYDNDGLDGPNR